MRKDLNATFLYEKCKPNVFKLLILDILASSIIVTYKQSINNKKTQHSLIFSEFRSHHDVPKKYVPQ